MTATVIFLFVFKDREDIKHKPVLSLPVIKDGTESMDKKVTDKTLSKHLSTEQIGGENEVSDEEKRYLMNEWLSKNGFNYLFSTNGSVTPEKSPLADYELQSIDNLLIMAPNDPLAELVLGNKLIEQNDLQKAKPFLYNSAVHGYARALNNMSDVNTLEAHQYELSGDIESANKFFVEAYAWANINNLRFYPDNKVLGLNKRTLVKSIEAERLKKIKDSARVRSQIIYEQLKLDRRIKGLGDFDNYIPPYFELKKEL